MAADGGGLPQQITKQGARLAMESPDGRHLYYAKAGQRQSDLWRVPVEGGEEALVLKDVSVFRFVPFGDGVYPLRDDDAEFGEQAAYLKDSLCQINAYRRSLHFWMPLSLFSGRNATANLALRCRFGKWASIPLR